MSVQAPCVFPGCDDGTEGDERIPRLTRNVICNSCRRRYSRVLQWLVLDFVTLKVSFPQPVESASGRRPHQKRPGGKGHPRAWASDTAAEIAAVLNETEDDLREQLGHDPAPAATVAEAARVQHAYHYLSMRFDELCAHPAADEVAERIASLHSRIRGAQGYGRRHFRTLDGVSCTNCDAVGFMEIGDGEGTEGAQCKKCQGVLEEKMFDFWIQLLVEEAMDSLIDEYDTRVAVEFVGKLIK